MAQGGWSALAAGIAATGQMAGAFATQAFNQHNMYKQYKYNKASMKYQYNLQRKANRIAYSDTMYSMRNAGLNPMLAYANGTVSQNVGAGSSVSSSTPNVDLDVSSALSYGLERQHMKNETKSTEQDIDTSKSQERLNDKSAEKLDKDIETQNINNELAITNTAKDLEVKNAQLEEIKQNIENSRNLTRAQVTNLSANSVNQLSSSAKTRKEIDTILQTEAANADWIKKHPKLYSFGKAAQMIAPGLVGASSAAAAGYALKNNKKQTRLLRR